VGTRCADHVTPLYPQKLTLTSPPGGGRSVGIVRVRTKATELINLYMFRAGLLLIIRRYDSVYTTVGICHAFMLTGCWQFHLDPANSQPT